MGFRQMGYKPGCYHVAVATLLKLTGFSLWPFTSTIENSSFAYVLIMFYIL